MPELARRYRDMFRDAPLKLANVAGKDGMALLRADEVGFAVGSMLEVPQRHRLGARAPLRSGRRFASTINFSPPDFSNFDFILSSDDLAIDATFAFSDH